MTNDKIEVYLRSVTLPSRLPELLDSYNFHYELEIHHREIYHWLRDQGFSKGRIFEPDSAAVLPALESALEHLTNRIVVYDLNTLSGRLRGWLAGVRRAPCVRIDGQGYSGSEAARLALRRAVESSLQP